MESTFHFYLGGSASTGSKRSFRLDPICTETLFPAGPKRVRYAWAQKITGQISVWMFDRQGSGCSPGVGCLL